MASDLAKAELARVKQHGWGRYVGRAKGLWVRVGCQQVLLVRRGKLLRSYDCSTARAGLGNRKNSFRTPTGWHEIAEKAGRGLPQGAILRARQWRGEIWRPGKGNTRRDLVLTRVLRLAGLEDGRNRDGNVDTWERMIYLHGTNAESRLGRPVSHGCIRLSNRDIVALFNRVPIGCRVLITR